MDKGGSAGTIPVVSPGEAIAGQTTPVVTLRYFAAAREAAGTGREELAGATVASVLVAAVARHGADFEGVLSTCRTWVNGDPATADVELRPGDEVAVLPPVSGGAR